MHATHGPQFLLANGFSPWLANSHLASLANSLIADCSRLKYAGRASHRKAALVRRAASWQDHLIGHASFPIPDEDRQSMAGQDGNAMTSHDGMVVCWDRLV